MADFVVSPLLRSLSEKLDFLQSRTCSGLPSDLVKLCNMFTELQSVIMGTEESEFAMKASWLKMVKELAYEVDGLLDDLLLLLSSSSSSNNSCNKVRNFFSISTKQINFPFKKMELELKGIKEILYQSEVHFLPGSLEEGMRPTETIRTTSSSFVNESETYGSSDADKIVGMLLSSPNNIQLGIISIVGMGMRSDIGMKTTVAQLAFNDERVERHFDLKAWVDVNGVFDEEMVMRKIVEYATQGQGPFLETDSLLYRLFQLLRGRRFFIVLDDVRNVDAEKWNYLKRVLSPQDCQGCKIIVTTGNEEVSRMMDSNNIYHLGKSRVHYLPRSLEEGIRPTEGTQTLSSFVNESEICGRNDTDKIVSMLLSSSVEEELGMISLVGMAGIGKTTLAQLAFNNERVERHFDLKVWVGVTGVLNYQAIMSEIIKHATESQGPLLESDILLYRIFQVLRGKRILIVLDDVWNVDTEKWEMLKNVLSPQHCLGCKILVTTRNEEVAGMLDANSIYHLEVLSDDDCWFLLKSRALDLGQEEDITLKEIAAKCRGLPLAVKVIGDLLFLNREQGQWLLVRDTDIFNLPEYEANILPILISSYYRLPLHLKQCFAYCSIFPKDYNIEREKLIQLWMAEGFIESYQEDDTLEAIGNNYFMELVWNSFFKVVKEDAYGNIIECKMHDFIHYLARSVARIGCSIVEVGRAETISERVRHSSLLCDFRISEIPECLFKVKNLRTLLLISATKYFTAVDFRSFKCLRVLDMSRTGIKKLPVSIGALKHLRYLDLSRSSIEKLPDSITGLKNLQTLKLSECYHLLGLPKDLKRLINLRHLDIWGCHSLSHLPSGIGQLTCLQTLPMFIVAKSKGCSIRELGRLNLGGKLEIKNLEHVRNARDVREANLMLKQDLRLLQLSWGSDLSVSWGSDLSANFGGFSELILAYFLPHPNLRELIITGYMGNHFPRGLWWSNLVKISITDCRGCEHLPAFGQLPNLEILYVKGMDAVKHIGNEFYGDGTDSGFPSLMVLEIYNMPNLVEWSNLTEAFPYLTTLIVEGCPKLTRLPLFPGLEDLALWNNSQILLCSLANQTFLSSLVINGFQELVSLPDELGNLNYIEKLTIYDCNDLLYLLDEGMRGLTSLRNLRILYCGKLKSLSNELRYLISLEELTIVGCPYLVSLPNGMQHLTSLRKLIIKGCPKLEYFPKEFERNTALLFLSIDECPQLERGLQRGGKYWPTIAHVPSIEINGCKISPSSLELERDSGRRGEASSALSRPHITPTAESEIVAADF